MPPTPTTQRPLDPIRSIKVKIGLLVALSILAAVLVFEAGRRSGVPVWLTVPVTLAAALGVTWWLARGMTSPLREMTLAADRMATGDYTARVTATSADEVGHLGQAFNAMAADLAGADQERRQLLATVSHELRTPLAAQRALLENLVDGVVTPDDAALQNALGQSERLSGLVSDLLELSRIDAGAANLQLADLRVGSLLKEAIAEARLNARSARIELRVEPVDLQVRADAARIAQLVANLLDNAIRHSPADGVIQLHALASNAGRTAGEEWTLEISDDGPGIQAGQAEHVFTRFGIGDDNSGGTGLGLAIANWVCQLHGGTIRALSPQPGEHGARIRAVLPRDPQPPAPSPTMSTTSAPYAGSATKEEPMTTPAATPTNPEAPKNAQVASGIPVPSTVDSMFGRWWPDSGMESAAWPLAASIGLGALAALVMPAPHLGLGTVLVLVLAGALVLSLSPLRHRPWTIASAVLCLGVASLMVLRAAEWLAVLSGLAAAALVTTALTGALGVPAMIAGAVSWVLSGLRGLPLLGRTLTATSRHRMIWPVLRTAAISLVALVVFGGLFASGDAVLGSWVSQLLPDIQLADTVVERSFIWFVVAGVVLAACYLAINPPRVNDLQSPAGRPVSRAWEWQVPIGVTLAVFLAFLAAQASAMWGGHEFVERTTGLSYGEYVHGGFAQLTIATALTLGIIAVTVRKAPRQRRQDRLMLRVLLGALCLLTLVVVASALFRMAVYQQAYGFTVLRVLVDAFELWLGLLVVLAMVAGIRLSGRWLPRAALLCGVGMLLVIGLANPEAWVASKNIERYHETGKLDLDYLASLGADAAVQIDQGLPDDLAHCTLGWTRGTDEDTNDWLEWNLGRARAATVEGYGQFGSAGECPSHLGE